jgi:hypothetical protein
MYQAKRASRMATKMTSEMLERVVVLDGMACASTVVRW